jgi:hypothetical protein
MARIIFFVAIFFATAAHAEDPVKISLKDIWAFGMPGTIDVEKLEPDNLGEPTKSLPFDERMRLQKESWTHKIRAALQPTLPKNGGPIREQKAGSGFVVEGTGIGALKNAAAAMRSESEPSNKISSATNSSLIFFSRQFSFYVHLDSVERKGNTIEVRYRFVPHMTAEVTEHFAIIPLGKLPNGAYKVEMIQLPMDKKLIGPKAETVRTGFAEEAVCKSFSFSVTENS